MNPGPASYAKVAAEAIRELNHATLPAKNALSWPSDVYDVLAWLATLAARLPQALAQLDALLTEQVDTGRIAVAGGDPVDDPVAAVITAGQWLHAASLTAHQLHSALDQAQAALTHAATAEPTADQN